LVIDRDRPAAPRKAKTGASSSPFKPFATTHALGRFRHLRFLPHEDGFPPACILHIRIQG